MTESLVEFRKLQQPIKVLSAIGDSRVGKSTNLNLVRYFWNGKGLEPFVKAFNTSSTVEACTEGVWMSSVPDKETRGSVVFLDVEGTDLGREAITDHVSIFTALLSSGVALFTDGMINNHNINFLYRMSRLTDAIWSGKHNENFPPLKVVLRGNLKAPHGVTVLEHVTKSILQPSNANKQEEAKVIGKYLPEHRLTVAVIPTVSDPKKLEDISYLTSADDYMNVVQDLTEKFKKDFPAKKTASGGEVDGQMLADLTVQLATAINSNEWGEFPSSYTALEKDLCAQSYKAYVEPLLGEDLRHLEQSRNEAMERFKTSCALKSEETEAAEKIESAIKQKREELAIKLREEEERKKLEQEQRRRREFEEQQRLEMEEQERRLREERRRQREAVEQRLLQEQRAREAEQERIRLEDEARRLQDQIEEEEDDVEKVVGAVVGTVLGLFLISDADLKENLTTVPYSQYNSIGLREVTWVWNKEANEEFGLYGMGKGVVAQEVQRLYPWAVSLGQRGYKQVDYKALDALLSRKKKTFSSENIV